MGLSARPVSERGKVFWKESRADKKVSVCLETPNTREILSLGFGRALVSLLNAEQCFVFIVSTEQLLAA